MNRMKFWLDALGLIVLTVFAQSALAATCTSLSNGNWNTAARWSCGHVPVAADTVVVAHNITLDVNPTVAGLTINAGKTLNDNTNGFDITVTGNVVNNGTYGVVGGGDLFMTGAGTTISGTGSFIDTKLTIDASNITLPVGSTMNFASGAMIEVGPNVTPSSFTLAGTITDVGQTAGKTILKVKNGSTATISGTVSAPSSVIDLDKNTTLTNNGTVNVQYLKGKDATSVWTQGANSNLTVTQTPAGKWLGTLNASATGNTVTYGGTANPLTPSGNAYYHLTLSGSGNQTLPTGLTVAGNFTMSGTATTTAPAALTVDGNFIIGAGNTFTPSTGTVTLNGASAQTIGGGATDLSLFNLTVNNPAGITLARNVIVTGTLTGPVTLASTCPTDYTLTSNGGATVQHSCPTPPAPMAKYHMDEAGWNGTAGEVLDSSGNGNHAQAFNSANTVATTPAIAGDPGTCRYGVFDNGGTITQGYVQTPLPNLTTNFTITAWIRTTNNSVSGQRILIDDQNNTGGYGFSLGDPGAGKLRLYSRAITPVIFDSPYTIANNTWYFVAAVADTTLKKRSIYVFSQAGALLSASTEAAAFTGTWGTDAGPVSIGAETNASGESPATFHFRGNLDEVQAFQSALNQTQLATIATQTHACAVAVPDHLEIQHASGTGLTCAASTLTIRACADATCTTPYTGGVSGTLSATGTPTVNWDGTTGGAAGAGFVIPNGSSSVTKNVQVATAGSVVFGITSPTPVPTNATACNFGTPACTFTADTAGFVFSDTTTGNSYTIPAQVSGIATPTLYLRAVQASTTNPAVCTPAIIGQTTAVNMGYVCNNPAACQAGNLATVNATAIAPGGTAVNLTFDANGSAPITARYDDVGQITLNASKTVTPFGGGTAITLNGNSNSFVVAPHHFGFSGITAGLIKAGNNFSATVTAYNGLATPTATPNFGKESAAEGVTLSSNLVSPAGGNNPAIANSIISGGTFVNGAATANNLSWGDVGLITLTANLTSGSYLGSALNAMGTSGNIGGFIPDYFDTAVVLSAGVPMPCPTGLTCPTLYNGFIYSGQPFSVQVIARNLAGGTTTNYHGAFGLSNDVTLTAWDALGSTTTPGALANNTVVAAAFSAGVGTTATSAYTFSASPTAPSNIFVRAVDSVNTVVTSLRAIPSSSVEGGVKVVSGRVKIGNAHGSELLDLPMSATVQYHDGTNWLASLTDSVTSLTLALTNYQCKSGCAWTTTPTPASGQVIAGILSFKLSKPTGGGTGSVDVNISAPNYLLTGSNGAAVNPSIAGRATFGVYKGANEFIYLRENY